MMIENSSTIVEYETFSCNSIQPAIEETTEKCNKIKKKYFISRVKWIYKSCKVSSNLKTIYGFVPDSHIYFHIS